MKQILFTLGIFLTLINCASQLTPENFSYSEYQTKNSKGEDIIVKSDVTGTLSEDAYDKLIQHLSQISNKKLNQSKNIVIHYIDNDPTTVSANYQVPWDIFEGNLTRQLNRIEKCNHLWVLNERVTNRSYYHADKIPWTVDQDLFLKELFFDHEGLNGGFVIIKSDKSYYLKSGEYTKNELLAKYSYAKQPSFPLKF